MNFKNRNSDMGKPPPRQQAPQATPLSIARQLSVYSLTLDEFQNTLGSSGKDFGSMNMDEFLKNIWTAEESHAVASSLGPTANSDAPGVPGSSLFGIQRQGSLALPRTLSQKTVDEVWRDLLKEPGSGQPQLPQQNRQQTLGEMTLEEFLVRAGAVREDPNNNNDNSNSNSNVSQRATANPNNNIFFGDMTGTNISNNNVNHGTGIGFSHTHNRNNRNGGVLSNQIQNSAAMARPYFTPVQVGKNVDVGMGNNGLMSRIGGGVHMLGAPDRLGKGNEDLASLSSIPYHVFGAGLRGRKSNGTVEKVVERRQRRMIKNRESASRSRARKQAYTMELETEVTKLKERNQELMMKQEEIMKMQKDQVMELIDQQHGRKRMCLRRMQTGPW